MTNTQPEQMANTIRQDIIKMLVEVVVLKHDPKNSSTHS